MTLRWNQLQKEIYDFMEAGLPNVEIKAKGYNKWMIKKVRTAVNNDDTPRKPPPKEKETLTGKPLYSATLKTKIVSLDPIVAVRYDSIRHALGLGDDYTLEQFLDESTELVTELVGAVPPGFVKEEEKEEVPV